MKIIVISGIVLLLLFITFCCYCCIRVGAQSDIENRLGEEKMKAVCEKCKKDFEWHEKDALVKYKYGEKYIVHCPYCDKLTKVNTN